MGESGVDLQLDVAGHADGTDISVSFGVAVSAALDLPGLHVHVDKATVGLVVALTQGGRLVAPKDLLRMGPVGLPQGMGAELGLPGFSGGGSLSRAGDQWRGALSAALGPISLSGFCLLDTAEFGLLVLIAAEFAPAIQLSFGFTLVGVGGLVAINHRPDRTALTDAVSSGDLSKLLFPRNPVAEADHLLPVLARCFPFSRGSVIVGPMVKLGWGTPTLIAATIGILCSGESVDILGRLAVTLPFEQLPLVRLEALIHGWVDANGIGFDASLANSSIVGVPIEGDFRARLHPGGGGSFAISAGGFHPHFAPPDGMGGMRRVGAEISPGAMLRARLGGYVAVTTSSVQFGANVSFEAGFGGFGIKGSGGFDTIIVFEPSFRFMGDFHASVSVECADFDVASISFQAHIEGPAPWRMRGHASISVLWWDVDVDVPEISWGPSSDAALPPARDPLAVLAATLSRPEGWTATSRDIPHLVRLRRGSDAGTAKVHPLAELGFRQSDVPLTVALQRMDGVHLGTPVTVHAQGPDGRDLPTVIDRFVPSQFFDLDTNTKQSSAGYASLPGGLTIDPGGHVAGVTHLHDDLPDTTVFEKARITRMGRLKGLDGMPAFVGHARIPVLESVPLVRVRDPGTVVVADKASLAASPDMAQAFPLHAGVAATLIASRAAIDPGAATSMQVVSAWEVAL